VKVQSANAVAIAISSSVGKTSFTAFAGRGEVTLFEDRTKVHGSHHGNALRCQRAGVIQ
jgi:hypothetical protein